MRSTSATATTGTPGTSRRAPPSSATASTSATPGWPTSSPRYYTQTKALFYYDDAPSETTYVSRNRQLSTFNDESLGAKVSYTVKKVPGRYDVKLNAAYEYTRFQYKDFTDIRTGNLYGYNANIVQLFVTATY